MKKLFIVAYDCGDGSTYNKFTFDEAVIKQIQKDYDDGLIDYGDGWGDGDGFHYDVLTLPAECTYESLGITPLEYIVPDRYEEDDEDEE